jgi:hypothetical protein
MDGVVETGFHRPVHGGPKGERGAPPFCLVHVSDKPSLGKHTQVSDGRRIQGRVSGRKWASPSSTPAA